MLGLISFLHLHLTIATDNMAQTKPAASWSTVVPRRQGEKVSFRKDTEKLIKVAARNRIRKFLKEEKKEKKEKMDANAQAYMISSISVSMFLTEAQLTHIGSEVTSFAGKVIFQRPLAAIYHALDAYEELKNGRWTDGPLFWAAASMSPRFPVGVATIAGQVDQRDRVESYVVAEQKMTLFRLGLFSIAKALQRASNMTYPYSTKADSDSDSAQRTVTIFSTSINALSKIARYSEFDRDSLVRAIAIYANMLIENGVLVRLHWAPDHPGPHGRDVADKAAKGAMRAAVNELTKVF